MGMRVSALQEQKKSVFESADRGAHTTPSSHELAETSEPAAPLRERIIDGTGVRPVSSAGVPMVVGEYKQPPAVGFDAQFKPCGFEQSVLESLRKANASLLADINTVSDDRRDTGAQTLSPSTMQHPTHPHNIKGSPSTTESSVQHPPLPHHAVLASNSHEADTEPDLKKAEVELKETEQKQELATTDSRGDPFLVTSPLSSDDENLNARRERAPAAVGVEQLVAELPTTASSARVDHKSSSPVSSYGSGMAVSKTAGSAILNSPGSMIVGLKMLDYSPVCLQNFPALLLRGGEN